MYPDQIYPHHHSHNVNENLIAIKNDNFVNMKANVSHGVGEEDICINGKKEVGQRESRELQSFLTQANDVLKPGEGEYYVLKPGEVS